MSTLPPPMPQPAPVSPPVPVRDQQKVDDDHLRLLAAFHFVMAGLSLMGLAFIGMHYAVMQGVFGNPEIWKNQKGGPPPADFFDAFKWMYLLIAIFIVLDGLINLFSGFYLRKKKHRLFSMAVAGINCLNMPLGLVLGVFTFIVLLRDSVRDVYENE